METVFANIGNLGYDGPALKKDVFDEAILEGCTNKNFINLIAWLGTELQVLCKFESQINPITDSEDAGSFLVELSSFLKEMECPYQSLTEGSIMDRLSNEDQRLYLLTYLSGELQAARIQFHKTPKEAEHIVMPESDTARDIKETLISLGFGKPPDSITPEKLFCELQKKIVTVSHPSTPKEIIGESLFNGTLSEKQWFQMQNLHQELKEEYKTRRNMLLTRLDVTEESFSWTPLVKKSEKLVDLYNSRRKILTSEPNVYVSDILAAQKDLIITEKTSCAAVRKNTKSSVNEVLIGAVPDRGGRPEEQQPPPPEVPSFQKNTNRSGGNYKPQQQQYQQQPQYQQQQQHYQQQPQQYQQQPQHYQQQQQYVSKSNQQSNPPRGHGYQGGSQHYNGNPRGGRNYADQSNLPNKNAYRDNQPRTSDNYTGAVNNPYPTVYYESNYQMMAPMGFGGYSQTGGNFQQYGAPQSQPEYQQYNARPQQRGRGGRGRGGRGYH